MINDEETVDLNEVSEILSLQVSLEMMCPVTVQDLPRYHPFTQDFGEFTN